MSAPHRAAARDRILAAAVRRIAREGIDEVRIARIATDAGVSPALIHYHFATREALLAQALDYSYAHAGDARTAAGELPSASHAERLDAMVRQCLPASPMLEQDWVLWVELWLRAVRHHELREVAEELYGRLHQWFADDIAAGVADGEFAAVDVDAVADLALALIDGYGLRALIGDRAIPLQHAHAAISAALARQLGCRTHTPLTEPSLDTAERRKLVF